MPDRRRLVFRITLAPNPDYRSRLLLHQRPADDACPICGHVVPVDEPPFFRDGRLVHVRCFTGGFAPRLPR